MERKLDHMKAHSQNQFHIAYHSRNGAIILFLVYEFLLVNPFLLGFCFMETSGALKSSFALVFQCGIFSGKLDVLYFRNVFLTLANFWENIYVIDSCIIER